EEVVQAVELDGVPAPPVPSLFRQTPISTTKRREPTRSESPVQRHSRRYRDRRQKFELYSDAFSAAYTRISTVPPGQPRTSSKAYMSVEAFQNSTTLPSRMWKTCASLTSTLLPPRLAVRTTSATPCSSSARTVWRSARKDPSVISMSLPKSPKTASRPWY